MPEFDNNIMNFTITDEPFAVGFMNCMSTCTAKCIGAGMREVAKVRPISMVPGEMLIGRMGRVKMGIDYGYDGGLWVNLDLLKKRAEENPEKAIEYMKIATFFQGKASGQHHGDACIGQEQLFYSNRTYWAGTTGHCNVDYGSVVHLGTDGVREKIAKYRPLHPEASEWYDGVEMALEGLDIIADRYRVLALENAQTAEGEDKVLFERIATVLETVPRKPAYDFFSAMQSFHLLFSYDGADSPGYFDYYMYPFYKDADKTAARKLLCCLWDRLKARNSWHLAVGGCDENWNDRTNALSYEILSVAKEKGYNKPNLSVRMHRNTSDEFWRAAVDCVASGIGLPAFYNDEVVCPALEAQGIPPEDSHLYTMNGCNQFDIQGKSHMGLEDGEICLLKCLEYALTNGECLYLNKRISIATGDATKFTSYEQLWEAFCRQVDYVTHMATITAFRCQKYNAMYAPHPFRSAFVQGCIEKGKDYCDGGPWYNQGEFLTQGLADSADSLNNIRHFVFETHRYTMNEVVDALKNNYKGYEEMYHTFRNYKEKFGNNMDAPDEIAGQIQRYFFNKLKEFRTYRDPVNGMYGGGCSTFVNAPAYGVCLGASANGRHKGDPLIADCIGATPGFDTNGPTAALCSALKYDHKLANSGFVMQLKFDKKIIATEDGKKTLTALIKTYFEQGGQQIAVSIVSPEELLDAKIHPENHGDLIVRVGGYSDHFVNLIPELQDSVVKRSFQEV